MNFLLKIVEGPNAGAEIALTEGVNVSVGRGDACDIILSDASLGEVACELEVTGERVMMIFPDGQQQRMENFRIVCLGTTALALGPADGVWQPLIRAEAPAAEAPAGEGNAPAASPAAEPAASPETAKADDSRPKTSRRRRITVGIVLPVLLLLVIGLGVAAVTLLPSEPTDAEGAADSGLAGIIRSVLPEDPPPPPPPPSLEALAKTYALKISEAEDGRPEIRGDFGTRSERLLATARIFHAHPGTHVNFTDRESLRSAVENMLALVSDGQLEVREVTGRAVKFGGRVASLAELRRILRAVAADVPRIEKMTCEEVRVGTVQISEAEAEEAAAPSQSAAAAAAEAPALDEARRLAAERESKEEEKPDMPVVGLLTAPYPCLVLRDGSRAVEGARFGDYTILSIQPDRVTLRGPEGNFVWRP